MLKDGAATFDAILAGVKTEDGMSFTEKRDALTMALRRLTLKKHVLNAGGTYMLPV